MRPSPRALIVPALFVLALALRLWGIDFGLPEVEEEAYPLKKAFDMWGWDRGAQLRLDPQTAGWPALSFYVQLALQKLQYLFGVATGSYDNPWDYFVRYHRDPTPMVLLARATSAVATSLAVAFGAAVALRLGGTVAGLVAGLLLAIGPLLVEHGQLVTPDALLVAFVALALWALLRFQAGEGARWLWLAAVATGLGAASKYTPVLLCPVIWLAIGLRRREEGLPLARLALGDRRLWIAAALCVASFVAASPRTLVDLPTLRRDLDYQALHLAQGHFGQTGDASGWWVYLSSVLPGALGWPGLLAGLAGLGLLARLPRGRGWPLVASFLLFWGVLGALETTFPRYMLPALLPLAVGAGVLVARAGPTLAARVGRGPAGVAVAALGGLLLVPPALDSSAFLARQGEGSTQQLAAAWIGRELDPARHRLVLEMYGPMLPEDERARWASDPAWPHLSPAQREQLLAGPRWQLQRLPMYSARTQLAAFYYDLRQLLPYSHVVTSGAVRQRYLREPGRYPEQVRFYTELDEYATEVARFGAGDGARGPEQVVYELGDAVRRARAARGELGPGWWREYSDRLHAPHFRAFVEGVGVHALQREQWEEAARWLQVLREVGLPDERARATELLGNTRMRQGRDDEARELFTELLQLDRDNPVALGNLGLLAERAGELERARQLYRACVEHAREPAQREWAQRRLDGLGGG